MSAMVFIDLEECIEKLELLTYAEQPAIKPVKKSKFYLQYFFFLNYICFWMGQGRDNVTYLLPKF